MNEIDYNSLIYTTRSINSAINKSLDRKHSSDSSIGQLLVLKIYCYIINSMLQNKRSENENPWISLKLLNDFLNRFSDVTEILK